MKSKKDVSFIQFVKAIDHSFKIIVKKLKLDKISRRDIKNHFKEIIEQQLAEQFLL